MKKKSLSSSSGPCVFSKSCHTILSFMVLLRATVVWSAIQNNVIYHIAGQMKKSIHIGKVRTYSPHTRPLHPLEHQAIQKLGPLYPRWYCCIPLSSGVRMRYKSAGSNRMDHLPWFPFSAFVTSDSVAACRVLIWSNRVWHAKAPENCCLGSQCRPSSSHRFR